MCFEDFCEALVRVAVQASDAGLPSRAGEVDLIDWPKVSDEKSICRRLRSLLKFLLEAVSDQMDVDFAPAKDMDNTVRDADDSLALTMHEESV